MHFSKNAYCIRLYFELDCLDYFSLIFVPPTEKLFPHLHVCELVMLRLTISHCPLCLCSFLSLFQSAVTFHYVDDLI